MTQQSVQPNPNHQGWTGGSTQSLGSALLRLETARELASVRLMRADASTLERWAEHEQKVERLLDECERLLATLGEVAVPGTLAGIRSLEREVCEFIDARVVRH